MQIASNSSMNMYSNIKLKKKIIHSNKYKTACNTVITSM